MDITVSISTEEIADLEALEEKLSTLTAELEFCDRTAAAHHDQVQFFC